jgi:hypothetical protein
MVMRQEQNRRNRNANGGFVRTASVRRAAQQRDGFVQGRRILKEERLRHIDELRRPGTLASERHNR